MKFRAAILIIPFLFLSQSVNADSFDKIISWLDSFFIKEDSKAEQVKEIEPVEIVDFFEAEKHLLPDSKVLKVRSLFLNKDFEALNQTLDLYLTETIKDIKKESDLFTAYSAFKDKDSRFEALFAEWMLASPEAYQPYLARGVYYVHMGWVSRGEKYSKETSKEQFENMIISFDKAENDLEKSISINKNSLPAYAYLLSISKADRKYNKNSMYLYKGMDQMPKTYTLRAWHMNNLKPRWGGSYMEMFKFVKETKPYEVVNPDLKKIEAFIYTDIAESFARTKESKEAYENYSKALSFGEIGYVYYVRGLANYQFERYEEGLNDLNRAIELDAENGEYYYRRTILLMKLDRINEAVEDAVKASLLDPHDDKTIDNKKWVSSVLSRKAYALQGEGRYQEAVEALDRAIRLDRNRVYNYSLRAHILGQYGQYDLAIEDGKIAISLEEKNFTHYERLHWLLKKNGNEGEVIKYWDRYMELVDDNPMAFFKRGEAKQTVGDLLGAVRDFEIAKELGHKGADNVIAEAKSKTQYKVQLIKEIIKDIFDEKPEINKPALL